MKISTRGRIVIPKAVRERQKIRTGEDFLVSELSNGDILLRRTRARAPKKSLVWHLRQLQGLQIPRITGSR